MGVSAVLRYNNCGSEVLDQRRAAARNPAVPIQFPINSSSSYPRRIPGCKSEKVEDGVEGSNVLQPKLQYMAARKVAAAQGGLESRWY